MTAKNNNIEKPLTQDEEKKTGDRILKKFNEYFKNKSDNNENHGMIFCSNLTGNNFEVIFKNESLSESVLKPYAAYFGHEKTDSFDLISLYKIYDQGDMISIVCIPDIIIEISSIKDKQLPDIKKKIYENYGVLEYWEINFEKKDIITYRLEENKFKFNSTYYPGDKVKTPLLKGFALSIHDVFHSRISLS